MAHPFEDSAVNTAGEAPYWRDVGTIDAYWDANIDLTATDPLLNLYDTRWPIWTYQPQLPPAKFVHNESDDRRAWRSSPWSRRLHRLRRVFRSLLFSSVRVHSFSQVNGPCCCPACRWAAMPADRTVIDRGCGSPTAW